MVGDEWKFCEGGEGKCGVVVVGEDFVWVVVLVDGKLLIVVGGGVVGGDCRCV